MDTNLLKRLVSKGARTRLILASILNLPLQVFFIGGAIMMVYESYTLTMALLVFAVIFGLIYWSMIKDLLKERRYSEAELEQIVKSSDQIMCSKFIGSTDKVTVTKDNKPALFFYASRDESKSLFENVPGTIFLG